MARFHEYQPSNRLVRFAVGTKHHGGKPLTLRSDSAPVVDGHTMFPKTVTAAGKGPVLKSGHNSSKVGAEVRKGKWKGMLIFTLSLEERATCPRSCKEWRSCYGNHMPFAKRYQHGTELVGRLRRELVALAARHPYGFVVRLHVLGDFYSVDYVEFWNEMLLRLPALHIFGYTARLTGPISVVLDRVREIHGDRFSVRRSGEQTRTIPGLLLKSKDVIVCPAQTGQTQCCGTCALCWAAPNKIIGFIAH